MLPRRKASPTPLPDGWILTDKERKDWKLGKIIGKGGFGLIHLASQQLDAPVSDDTNFVIKVEFHENGSLFTELKFYQRAAKQEYLQRWKRARRLNFLGIPTYWGSGLCEHQGTRYRFMVVDRLGTDLQKVCQQNDGKLKRQTVLQLGCRMLHMLEYIHDHEYVHGDIKAANLLLGYADSNKVYLADYGLSYRYCPDGIHKEYKEDPKKRHNGTIEYMSLDAHKGAAPSRRSDLETLGYCMLHWLCGMLPWDSVLKNTLQVQEAKARLMANLPDSVLELPGSGMEEVATFLQCVKSLAYKEKPDYRMLLDILAGGVARLDGPLDFSSSVTKAVRQATARQAEAARPKAAASEGKQRAACPVAEVPSPTPIRRRPAKATPHLAAPDMDPGPNSRVEKPKVSQAKRLYRLAQQEKEGDAHSCQWAGESDVQEHLGLPSQEPSGHGDPGLALKLYSCIITVLFFILLALIVF